VDREGKVVDVSGPVETARTLVGASRGILAADESVTTMSKRLEAAGIPASAEARRDYRALLLTTPGLSRWVSGIIFCEETLRQELVDGTPIPEAAGAVGIGVGIKVDTGTRPLPLGGAATVTEGLDGLGRRLEEYVGLGATFAKWRAVLDPALVSGWAIRANAHALARYAAACQEAGITPIVEPEVIMDGDHGVELCEEVTSQVLAAVFAELDAAGVDPAGMVLKPNMVVAGVGARRQPLADEVASRTVTVLAAHVPDSVPGIAFLSGGQANSQACTHLGAINAEAAARGAPWRLTFSFGRALVSDALARWGGRPGNRAAAQEVLADNCARAGAVASPLEAMGDRHG
jgi:fructose-bisphosphate aldolase class I